MSRAITIALLQLNTPADSNLDNIEGAKKAILDSYSAKIEAAASQDVNVIALPAFANSPYFSHQADSDLSQLAEYLPEGDSVQQMMVLARQYSMVILLPLMEIDMAGMFYNSVAVIDADGSYLGKYRQSHLYSAKDSFEHHYFRIGNLGYPVFQTLAGNIGITLGYDSYFPEVYRILGLAGAELVVHAGAVQSKHVQPWQLSQQAHALSNGYFVAAVNRMGAEADIAFAGQSFIVDPRGQVIAQADENDSMISANLDLDSLQQVRLENPFYRDRRPEGYEEIVAL